MKIYLDHSATTPPDPEVALLMNKVQKEFWGNASSAHSFGLGARNILNEARDTVAFSLNCQPEEVIFTSGGSESNNLAIKGLIDAYHSNTDQKNNRATPHVITSAVEHHSVLDTVKELEKQGLIEASYVTPQKNGVIRVEDIDAEIKDNTVLVSIMYVNNEIGTVQPIKQIAQMIAKNNELRIMNNGKKSNVTEPNKHNSSFFIHNSGNKFAKQIYFHTDAVQAMEYFQTGVRYLGVDLLTFSAHKFYGPKGVGALFVKNGTPIIRQIVGGNQENKMRAGTENVAGIAGLSAALVKMHKAKADSKIEESGKLLPELILYDETKRLKQLRDKLIKGLMKIPDTRVNGCLKRRSPNNVNVSFKNAEGESILLMLDKEGIAASSGSACTSGSLEPSHVLTAIGVSPEWSHGSIRFSLGKHNTEEEIDRVIEILPGIIKKLRQMSPYGK
ncbi:MAG: Cysteine desulfurase [bacterium ADurb.Bin212]|nr:MAG: Cysteine desulfurase [bacterium ADurb.Bin212]